MQLFFLLYALSCSFAYAAPSPKVSISNAAWSATTGILTVKGKLTNAANNAIDVYDSSGRLLVSTTADSKTHKFAVQISDDRSELLCSVSAKADGVKVASKPIGGVDKKNCGKTPICKITGPVPGTNGLVVNSDIDFTATATLKDKKAGPLQYEWDFSGGVMGELIPNSNPPAYKRPEGLNTKVQFVRNNASYQVHFSATDSQKRRCEDTIRVAVGVPTTDLPNITAIVKTAKDGTPAKGHQLAGKADDVVVLPYPDMTMQAHGDARYIPNLYVASTPGSFNTLNALAYSKALQPKKLTKNDVILRYSAAINKFDPVGANSINSTSQNWPLTGAAADEAPPFANASVQKSDMWEKLVRPDSTTLGDDYMAMSWMDGFAGGSVKPDEGFKVDPSVFPVDHGSYMPGFNNPFVLNAFQDFSIYNDADISFSARNVPVTDIDDYGRVNPYPLMRVQAIDANSKTPIATTDAVMAVGKDFHCSECHAKGKIAANPELDFSAFTKAYHSSSEYNSGYHCPPSVCNDTFVKPTFYDAVDQAGNPSENLADKEYAAIKNANALHDFYDNLGLVWWMENGVKDAPEAGGKFHMDMNANCTWCHATMINPLQQIGYPGAFTTNTGKKAGDMMYYPSYSQTMHKFHEQLQLDPSDKSKILREESGRPKLWDLTKDGSNPNTMFPTVNAEGKSLPMEQSCLRCHSGHREQLYRDRMYTAGVTCYDCHGDMAAVGKAHNKPKPGPEGEAIRVEWMEQPDCGSCHMGDGNLGKAGTGKGGTSEAFSAGVMRRAFWGNDPSATTRTPLMQRFAVQPVKATEIKRDDWVDSQYSTRHSTETLSKPLYRLSKDTHGDVACGACHGGTHEVWPNRDPKANDNVTALQLQGHTGTILECNVCHTADSFKEEANLDGGIYMVDLPANSGVLGGPHNMHPVNDPYWWKTSQDAADTNTDQSTYGGWHNNYAKKPGKDGEDQCAACHGNDHKGTRLSKTPVARVFDFSGFDMKKLKKAGFKAKVIKVPAGTEIGCDTCHSIPTSCKDSPADTQCGVASENAVFNTNHDPVFSSETPVNTGILGAPYSFKFSATDQDGDSLTYSFGLKHSSMSINQITGEVTTTWPESIFTDYKHGPFTFPYSVNVSDGKGGYTTQNVTMTLECPTGKSWQWDGDQWAGTGSCVAETAVKITSKPSVTGINSGAAFSYPVTATDAGSLPITYSLINYHPNGMSIDATSGVVSWTAKTVSYGQTFFQVKATNSAGVSDIQLNTLTICVPNKNWNNAKEMCE